MSDVKRNFFGMVIAIPIVSILLLFGVTEMVCNSFGYTMGPSVVGPRDPSDTPSSETEEIAWKCAGFRRKRSGEWGFSGEFDQGACRALRDRCLEDGGGCDDWEKVQQGRIGWGEENNSFFRPLNERYKQVDMRLLVGDKATAQPEPERPEAGRSDSDSEGAASHSDSSSGKRNGPRARTPAQDPMERIDAALRSGDLASAGRLIQKLTTGLAERIDAAIRSIQEDGPAAALVQIERISQEVTRLQQVLAKPEYEFPSRRILVRQLDSAQTAIKDLMREMRQSMP